MSKSEQSRLSTYPLFEVLHAETDGPICIVVWTVRAIYPVRVGDRGLTRIEYLNGDSVDSSDNATRVISSYRRALRGRGLNVQR